MPKYITIFFLYILVFSGCSNVPSTEDIDKDITLLNTEIKEANEAAHKYKGGLLAVLTNVRLETLKTTKTMLEVKKKGYQRYIPISYSIEGKKYTAPENKDDLLQEINNDLENLQKDELKAEKESSRYGGGLLGVLSLTQVATVKNSAAFLNQRRLLLKYDIPYYSMIPAPSKSNGPGFKPTPGEDINKF